MGVICERKICFCWWKLMAFFTLLSSAHLLCWRPTGFSGDFDTHELLHVAFEPLAGVCVLWGMFGTAWFKRKKLSCVCFGMLGGNTVLMAECQGTAGAQRASAGVLSEGACWSDNRYAFFPFF